MVKIYLYLFCLWRMGIGLLEAAPFADASIDSMSNQAHFPLQGTLTITHKKEEKIDPQSFTLEGKNLDTSFVKDVKMSASLDTLVSIYSFQLPAQDKGLYVLPSIELKIDGKTYKTQSSTYEVQEEKTSLPSASLASTNVIFRLEASVKGASKLYPGERTQLFYRISYNRSIDLTQSYLPMVHPAHFQKIGDVHIRDYQLKDLTIQELTQEIEANETGTFSFGPSSIEGYAYTLKSNQKIYEPALLKAEAPIISLEVKSFPTRNQPTSFTGALGQIEVAANLQSSNTLTVGEILQLQVKIQGVTNLTDLRLPSLLCQPGFSGFFQTSELPALAEVKDKTKIFTVELRPLTSLIHQIPSIEFSSFNPSTKKYVIQSTLAIPLNVTVSLLEPSINASVPLLTSFAAINQWPTPLLTPLEIEELPPIKLSMNSAWIKGPGLLWMIPLGIFLLLLQNYWHSRWQQRPRQPIAKSQQFFKQALKTDNLQVLEHAFWWRLWEKGIIPQGERHLDKLALNMTLKPIYLFLFQLQALQYSKDKNFDSSQLKTIAQQLFNQI